MGPAGHAGNIATFPIEASFEPAPAADTGSTPESGFLWCLEAMGKGETDGSRTLDEGAAGSISERQKAAAVLSGLTGQGLPSSPISGHGSSRAPPQGRSMTERSLRENGFEALPAAAEMEDAGATAIADPVPWGPKITTVMIRRIPRLYTQTMLLQEVTNRGFEGLFDFLYVPYEMKKGVNVGYGFMNFIEPIHAQAFKEAFDGLFLDRQMRMKGKSVRVHPAAVQGYEANYQHFLHTKTGQKQDPCFSPIFLGPALALPLDAQAGAQPANPTAPSMQDCSDEKRPSLLQRRRPKPQHSQQERQFGHPTVPSNTMLSACSKASPEDLELYWQQLNAASVINNRQARPSGSRSTVAVAPVRVTGAAPRTERQQRSTATRNQAEAPRPSSGRPIYDQEFCWSHDGCVGWGSATLAPVALSPQQQDFSIDHGSEPRARGRRRGQEREQDQDFSALCLACGQPCCTGFTFCLGCSVQVNGGPVEVVDLTGTMC